MEVYRFSKRQVLLVTLWLAGFIGVAAACGRTDFAALGIFGAAAAYPALYLFRRNRRIEVEGNQVRDYDWLGRLRAEFTLDQVLRTTDSSDESDSGPYLRVHTTEGVIDIVHIERKQELLSYLLSKS